MTDKTRGEHKESAFGRIATNPAALTRTLAQATEQPLTARGCSVIWGIVSLMLGEKGRAAADARLRRLNLNRGRSDKY